MCSLQWICNVCNVCWLEGYSIHWSYCQWLQSWESRKVGPRFFQPQRNRQGPLKEVDVSINNSPGPGQSPAERCLMLAIPLILNNSMIIQFHPISWIDPGLNRMRFVWGLFNIGKWFEWSFIPALSTINEHHSTSNNFQVEWLKANLCQSGSYVNT